MHGAADAVADEGADDAVAALVRDGLDGMADVAEAVARDGGGDAGLHAAPRRVDQLADLARHVADDPGARAVGMPAVDDAADVDADEVAVGQPAAW